MRFNVLGPLTVVDGIESLSLGGPKQRTVLAMLVARFPDPVSADLMIDSVYGDEPHASARRTIQTYISNLRKILGEPVIDKAAGGWVLRVDRADIDYLEFEDACSTVSQTSQPEAGSSFEQLNEALALWRGLPYADIEANGHLDGEITRLNELRLAAMAARIDADLAAGRHAELVGEIEALIAEYPFQERFRAQHMMALYRSGRQKEALHSFGAIRGLLANELGLDPTPELQDLEQKILEQDPSLDLDPPSRIEERAVLVVDPGDPMEPACADRSARLEALAAAMNLAVERENGDLLGPAGAATYAVFADTASAVAAAESIALQISDGRVAVDFGEVEASDNSTTGPPLARAARLVATANPGQVVLSQQANRALTSDGRRTGIRIESLGEHDIIGLDSPLAVFQLLVDDPPRSFPPLRTDRVPPPLPGTAHRHLPGYELREVVGQGSVGTMYRSYQPSVGREVVVEVIGRSLSSDPDFIRRFEADVQRLALLDHPHLLPILDYWRDTEGAFIVYPYRRGGLLSDSLDDVDYEAVVQQICSAISYVHSYGIVHGRLSPSQVVLDEAGNAYVFGFPVAVPSQTAPAAPAYLPPESTGDDTSAADDIYALGMIARVLSAGSEPDPDRPGPSRGELVGTASSVGELVGRLLPDSDHPEARYTVTRNPYKGLAAFQEPDAPDFYGRSAVVDWLLERIEQGGFLAVVGPSGIGKSSVVRAGLIPRLRAGAVGASESWAITDMHPGSQPFRELERALERVAIDVPPQLRESLIEEDPSSLELAPQALPSDVKLTLVIDQFEELFTMSSESTRRRFLELLVTAARSGQARVIITLRADFLDRPLRYSTFGELLGEGLFTLTSPNFEELQEAIVGPAEGVGIRVEPALAERIVSEIHDRSGALPLLQHALTQLFDLRNTDLLSLDMYERIGGVTGSLGRRAEQIFESLDVEQRAAAKQLLLRLVAVSDHNETARRRVRVRDLEDLEADMAMDVLASGRMLVLDSDPDTRAPTVEVAHEALLTHWPRLADWIEEAREDLTLSHRLEQARSDWVEHDRAEAYLLTGGRLAQHLEWTDDTSLDLTSEESQFLEASVAHDRELQARRRRRRRWITGGFVAAALIASLLGLVAMTNATEARSRELAASSIVAADLNSELSFLLALQAARLDPSAEAISGLHTSLQEHRAVATVEWAPDRLPFGFFNGVSVSPDGSQIALSGSKDEVVVYEVSNPATSLWSHTFDFEGVDTSFTKFSDDGQVVFVLATSPTPFLTGGQPADSQYPWGIYGFDAETGEQMYHVPTPGCSVPAVWLSPGEFVDIDKPGFAIGFVDDGDGGCVVEDDVLVSSPYEIDFESGRLIHNIDAPMLRPPSHAFGFGSVSPDGAVLAIGGRDEVIMWTPETGEISRDLTGPHAAFSPDGSQILMGDDPVQLWDLNTQQTVREFDGSYWDIRFSSDGRLIYGPRFDGASTDVFDAASGELLHSIVTEPAFRAAMSSDGSSLLTAGSRAVVHDLATSMRGEPDVIALGPSRTHRIAAALGLGGGLAVTWDWDLADNSKRTVVFRPDPGEIVNALDGWGAAISPDGEVIAYQPVLSTDSFVTGELAQDAAAGTYHKVGAVTIADAITGQELATLDGLCEWFDSDVPGFAEKDFGPGTMIPGPDCDDDRLAEWTGDIVFSPDGDLVAVTSRSSNMLGVWQVDTGELVWRDDVASGSRLTVAAAFSPDQELLAVSGALDDGGLGIHVLDAATGERLAAVSSLGNQPLYELEFTPDGEFLMASDLANQLKTFETDTWTELDPLRATEGEGVRDLDNSPDGSLVASAGDRLLRVWSQAERSKIFEIELNEQIRAVGFTDDDHLLVLPVNENVAAVITLDEDELLAHAATRATRTFTQQECTTYNIDPCPTLDEMQGG